MVLQTPSLQSHETARKSENSSTIIDLESGKSLSSGILKKCEIIPKPSTLLDSLNRTETLITEWTPTILVASYFTFSTSLYLVCTQWWLSFFWFLYLVTNSYIAGSTVIEAIMSIAPCRDARKALRRVEENDWVFPTPDEDLLIMDLIIVAYLPNEKDIIMDRIAYATEKIVYPRDKIRITVLYNTPKPIEPLETELCALVAKIDHLRVIKIPNSTSKADNLNYFFTLNTGSDIISIFDADHYPHPYGPRFAAENLISDPETQVVQGRCIVFNTNASWISAMIGVEFDKIYASSHPGRAALWDFGLFTGSNGYWRTGLLRELGMDCEMLTEDIDSALRAFSGANKVVHNMNCISYELAPTQTKQFWSQRLRWAQGWAQASFKHVKHSWLQSNGLSRRTKTQRFGLFSLLLIRELSYYLTGAHIVTFLFFQYPIAYWMFILSMICLIVTLVITNSVKSEFVKRTDIIMFSIIFPFYLIVNAVVGLYGHARQIVSYSSWNPTART